MSRGSRTDLAGVVVQVSPPILNVFVVMLQLFALEDDGRFPSETTLET